MKFLQLLKLIFLFFILLISINYIHFNFYEVNVVLYSSILDVFIAVLITILIVKKVKFFRVNFSNFEIFQSLVIIVLLGYAFAITIPTIIDRSLSFYILEKIQERGGGMKINSFENLFKSEYMIDHRLVDIRLTEQLESGSIIVNKDCVKLTEKGQSLVIFSQFYRKYFLPKNRLLMGEYSDYLIRNNLNKINSYEYNDACS